MSEKFTEDDFDQIRLLSDENQKLKRINSDLRSSLEGVKTSHKELRESYEKLRETMDEIIIHAASGLGIDINEL